MKLSTANRDVIRDFAAGDIIALSSEYFRGLSSAASSEAVDPGRFKDLGVAYARKDADDRLLYNHKTGVLSYDSDGSGKAHAIEFARIENHASIDVSDFLII